MKHFKTLLDLNKNERFKFLESNKFEDAYEYYSDCENDFLFSVFYKTEVKKPTCLNIFWCFGSIYKNDNRFYFDDVDYIQSNSFYSAIEYIKELDKNYCILNDNYDFDKLLEVFENIYNEEETEEEREFYTTTIENIENDFTSYILGFTDNDDTEYIISYYLDYLETNEKLLNDVLVCEV